MNSGLSNRGLGIIAPGLHDGPEELTVEAFFVEVLHLRLMVDGIKGSYD
jgi:hypothetical protein